MEEFFRVDKPYLSLTDYPLEQSPCFHIIGSKSKGGHIRYHCKLHPKIVNTNLNSIEHHCKYSDHIQHKEAILRILQTENSIKSVSSSNSVLTTNQSVEDHRQQ